MRKVPFPRYIDRVRMVGILEMDEFFMVFIVLIIMLIVGFAIALNVALTMLIGLIIGGIVAATMRSIKRNYADGYIYHMLYRRGIYHPVKDDKALLAKHPVIAKKNIKLLPSGFVGVLVG